MAEKIHTIQEIKATVQPIAEHYGLERVCLFGSYARGEATPESDIDLRVDKGKLKGMFALSSLYSDLEAALDTKIDLLTTASLDEDFLQEIAQEEVLVYGSQA